ncbi:unnamed protein product [Medioppia subpectinata]|uniref:Amino acid transporter n=1 Tax=Medioppia subpectinata TaxID=1979941 RepID=A0A7R9KVV9_9ACAR|nr:unnamed protein product [Medioppia subpectinata]CAG2110692.1 unnamed protein product [Medioppia subpectinata]
MTANGKIDAKCEDERDPKPGTGLVGFVSNVFLLLTIADSIVHLVKEADYKKNHTKEESKTIKCPINAIFMIFSSFVYSISLTIIMILSCLCIDFNNSSISLICHIIACYFGLAVGVKLLINTFAHKKTTFAKVMQVFQHNILALSTLIMVVLAIVMGIILRETNPGWNQRSVKYIGFIGELFLRMLKGLVLPLIFTSLVYAMSDIDTRLFGKIGFRTIAFYLSTTLLSIILGIILVISIQPGNKGEGEKKQFEEGESIKLTTIDTILDLIRNLFPDNLIEAAFVSFTTVLKPPNGTTGEDLPIEEWEISSGKSNAMNILGLVVFGVVFGVIIGRNKKEAQVLADFFKAFNNIMMGITVIIIQFTPLAVLFLVLPQLLSVKDLNELLGSVGWYTLTVLVGIFIHGTIILPIIFIICTRQNPLTFISKMSAAMMTGVDRRIVRFCIPIGATINMDGTALYEAVAAIYIAQYRDVDLDFVKIIVIAITATAASIGAAGIPQAGLITMVIVLNAVGLPAEDAALIVVIDWLIDRFRTVLNVLGDAFGAGIVYHMSQKDIAEFDAQEMANEIAVGELRNIAEFDAQEMANEIAVGELRSDL